MLLDNSLSLERKHRCPVCGSAGIEEVINMDAYRNGCKTIIVKYPCGRRDEYRFSKNAGKIPDFVTIDACRTTEEQYKLLKNVRALDATVADLCVTVANYATRIRKDLAMIEDTLSEQKFADAANKRLSLYNELAKAADEWSAKGSRQLVGPDEC